MFYKTAIIWHTLEDAIESGNIGVLATQSQARNEDRAFPAHLASSCTVEACWLTSTPWVPNGSEQCRWMLDAGCGRCTCDRQAICFFFTSQEGLRDCCT